MWRVPVAELLEPVSKRLTLTLHITIVLAKRYANASLRLRHNKSIATGSWYLSIFRFHCYRFLCLCSSLLVSSGLRSAIFTTSARFPRLLSASNQRHFNHHCFKSCFGAEKTRDMWRLAEWTSWFEGPNQLLLSLTADRKRQFRVWAPQML